MCGPYNWPAPPVIITPRPVLLVMVMVEVVEEEGEEEEDGRRERGREPAELPIGE